MTDSNEDRAVSARSDDASELEPPSGDSDESPDGSSRPADGGQKPNTSSAPRRKRTTYERQALVVSIAAFIAAAIGTIFSGVQTIYGYQQAEIAADSLEEARRLFDAAGPQLNVVGSIKTWDLRDPLATTRDVPISSNPEVDVSSPTQVSYLYVQLQNTGRESTTITNVEYDLGYPRPWRAGDRPPPGEIYNGCSVTGVVQDGIEPPKACTEALPHTMEPGTIYTVTLYMPIHPLKACCVTGTNIRIDAVGVFGSPVSYKASFRPV